MPEKAARGKKFIRVQDNSGNTWLCPLEALKHVSEATQEELENCVEPDVVARYAGDIEAKR